LQPLATRFMNILAVGAHPDDVELGCFGTLLEKKSKGHRVWGVALAPGAYGKHTWDTIKKTWSKASRPLREGRRTGEYILGKFPIGRLQHDWDTVGFVDEIIQSHDIDTVITHHYGEAHQDHIAAQRIAVSAARRRVDRFWLWESSIYTHRNVYPFRPQVYVPISKAAFDGKMEALQSYLDANLLEPQEVEAHRHIAQYRGAELRHPFAEAFEVVWEVHDQ